MFLSLSLKTKAPSLYRMTGLTVCLFVMLQLAAWYPLLSETQSDLSRNVKRAAQSEVEWQTIQRQANKLKEATFINEAWVSHSIESEKGTVPTQWLVEGSALVVEWQALLEKVEEGITLGLQSFHWKREPNGQWQGRLLYDIKAPLKNREYHNWLPTRLQANHFIEKDWRILSTMKTGESTSALLEHKRQRHWVRQGSWLPSVGLMVDTVSFDQITLSAKDGAQVILTVRKGSGVDE